MEATMPSTVKQALLGASVVVGMVVFLLAVATSMVMLGLTGQVKAPRLSSTETKLLSRGETDFWLRDHQQFRRTFVGQSREWPR
jgi:hypothetical protein